MYKLSYGVQNYDWGKQGKEALVGTLFAASSNTSVDESKKYAEIWIGTHPSMPSEIETDKGQKEKISDFLKTNPAALGKIEVDSNKPELPYLFKVLSIATALSIQAHPDLERAKKLHEKDPKNYKDPNHKPEMAIALTDFECFCNFCPKSELIANLSIYKSIGELVSAELFKKLDDAEENSEQAKDALREILKAIMSQDEEVLKKVVDHTIGYVASKSDLTPRDKILKRLQEQYPNDIGIIISIFLNYSQLKPGQAVILHPNEPHSYIAGECIESITSSLYLIIKLSF